LRVRPTAAFSFSQASADGVRLLAGLGEFLAQGLEAALAGFVLFLGEGGLLDFERSTRR
jgi:hypothetical protein